MVQRVIIQSKRDYDRERGDRLFAALAGVGYLFLALPFLLVFGPFVVFFAIPLVIWIGYIHLKPVYIYQVWTRIILSALSSLVLLVFIVVMYNNFPNLGVSGYLFWYLAGLIIVVLLNVNILRQRGQKRVRKTSRKRVQPSKKKRTGDRSRTSFAPKQRRGAKTRPKNTQKKKKQPRKQKSTSEKSHTRRNPNRKTNNSKRRSPKNRKG